MFFSMRSYRKVLGKETDFDQIEVNDGELRFLLNWLSVPTDTPVIPSTSSIPSQFLLSYPR